MESRKPAALLKIFYPNGCFRFPTTALFSERLFCSFKLAPLAIILRGNGCWENNSAVGRKNLPGEGCGCNFAS
jgi:hypothetical protein